MRFAVLTALLAMVPFIVAACATSTPTVTQSPPGDLVNDCSHRVPEATPKPDLKAPTESTSASTGPVASTTETPSAYVVAYLNLPAALPAPVEAWKDAVVRVRVELAGGRVRDQQGLIVADESVLTVLDLTEEIASLSVGVSGRGTLAAELEPFDPRTGAALLTVDIADLPVAPRARATVSNGEPVLLLSRGLDGDGLEVKETYAVPAAMHWTIS